jgi:hypothetical protein
MRRKVLSIKYKKNKIKKLLKENEEIDSFISPMVEDDLDYNLYNLKYRKEQKIRSFIIEFHLAFENQLDYWIREFLTKSNPRIKKKKKDVFYHKITKSFRYTDSLLEGNSALNFTRKLLLVRSLGLIDDRYYNKLIVLNKLRDACGHAWVLDEVIRKGKKRHKKKKFVLDYKGRNLLRIEVFKDFLQDYKDIYLRSL